MRLVVVLAALCSAARARGQDVWARADAATVRLPPDSFPRLPVAVRADLKRRGCTVPQSPEDSTRHNVISGAFIRSGRSDWAVLCSIEGSSRVLVYRAGITVVVDSLGQPQPDRDFLQGIGNGRIGFSRAIRRVGARYIKEQAREYDGPKPPPIDHDGIEDAFVGKASAIAYHYKGRWLTLQGAN